jgi:alpha-glucosidase
MSSASTTHQVAGPVPAADAGWWRQAVVYQIYPRSFADSDGNGLGDLRGIISRIPYLAALGIDAVWLSPFYPSALADGGYDVDDYRDVDPRLGTLADFDELTAGLHARKIKVIVDIVPNHTPGSARRWPRRRAPRPGTGTSSATGSARTVAGRRRTGPRCSAARPGRESPTGSGTCTCSPRNSRT